MASVIELIDEYTIPGVTAAFTLAGGSSATSGNGSVMDSTYDTYLLKWIAVDLQIDNRQINFRFTASGTQVTDALYDSYAERTRGSSFTDLQANNAQNGYLSTGDDAPDQRTSAGFMYIYHPNDATKYTSSLVEEVGYSYNPYLQGMMGGTILKKLEAHDGIYIFNGAGDSFQAGKFKLYGIRS